MIFVLFGSRVEVNFPRFVIPLKPIIRDVCILGCLWEGVYKVLKFLYTCDGGVDGSPL